MVMFFMCIFVMTYLFRLFKEKQVMEVFVRLLKVSEDERVALQLLQSLSFIIQNLKSEHAISKLVIY